AHHVRLRAARSGRSGERLYTITITVKDIHGNVTNDSVTVRVLQRNSKSGLKIARINDEPEASELNQRVGRYSVPVKALHPKSTRVSSSNFPSADGSHTLGC